jgi:hypothetical protein
VYIREVTIPAGSYALGNLQLFEHLNIVIRGKVAVIGDSGVRVIEGPSIFTGQPGRKLGYCIEECVWQNVYPNPDNCRDIETLENRWTEKSAIAKQFLKIYAECLSEQRQADRDDFERVLKETGLSAEQVQKESEVDDLIAMPAEYATRLSVRDSHIHGKGLFLSSPVLAGQIVAPARIGEHRTDAGRYVNHSKTPNCFYKKDSSGDIWLCALRDIDGCVGGHHGEELTADYLQAATISGRIEVLV